MSDLTYTIKQFDVTDKSVLVEYSDGHTSKIKLSVPLPTNQTELESIIKKYAAPLEVVQAQNSDTDLSFINTLVGNEYTTTRFSIAPNPPVSNVVASVTYGSGN
jgi:hypothetical protein